MPKKSLDDMIHEHCLDKEHKDKYLEDLPKLPETKNQPKHNYDPYKVYRSKKEAVLKARLARKELKDKKENQDNPEYLQELSSDSQEHIDLEVPFGKTISRHNHFQYKLTSNVAPPCNRYPKAADYVTRKDIKVRKYKIELVDEANKIVR